MQNRLISKPHFLKLILFLLPVLLYINTINNDYALDDSIVITKNRYVQKGFKGIKEIFTTETFTGFFKQKKDLVEGGRYRPLSVATFAVEHQFFGNNPGVSHFLNSLIYALLCLILFNTLVSIINYLGIEKKVHLIAFSSTLLFIVHPTHTEVVANIKGRDELLALVFLLLSIQLFLRSWQTSKLSYSVYSALCIFLALLSKENAIFIWPILLLLLVFNYKKKVAKYYFASFAMLLLATLSYLYIRSSVVGGIVTSGSNELMNNPYLFASTGQKYASILYTLLVYFKLLFIPHPLTYDYYPYHIELHSWADPWVILSLLLHSALLMIAFIRFRKNKILSFGILLYLVCLVPMTNLFVNIGSFMNERFLFLPSVGAAFAIGSFLPILSEDEKKFIGSRKLLSTLFWLILLFFIGKTITRNTDWKNNFVLFTHDVKISSGSAKGNCAAGGVLYETSLTLKNKKEKEEMLNDAIRYLTTSIKIYPNYIDALLLLGNAHFELDKNFNAMNKAYNRIFTLAPTYQLAISNYTKMLSSITDTEIRKSGFRKVLELQPSNFEANYQLGITYGRMLGHLDTAIVYLGKAVKIQPENSGVNRDLGVAYAMLGDFSSSLPYFEKVVALKPENPDNYINLGMTYQNLGFVEKAKLMFIRAEELKRP